MLEERADDVYAERRAQRAAVDARFAAHVVRAAAARRAHRETAWQRMRVPSESEWTERNPEVPRRLYGAFVALAEHVNAAADRRRPELVRRALRRAPVASRRPACGRSPRPRARARVGHRQRGSRRSTRSSDDDAGDGGAPDAGAAACGCRRASR